MYIAIELYRNDACIRQGLQFDVGLVVSRLFWVFPTICFEEEYYEMQLRSLKEAVAAKEGLGSGAIETSQRDAEELGPRCSFFINGPEGLTVMKGVVSRFRISFSLYEQTPYEMRQLAEQFLASFSIATIRREEDESSAR